MPGVVGLDYLLQLLESIDSRLGTSNATLSSIDSKLGVALDTGKSAWKTYLIESLPAGDNVIGRIKVTDGTNLLTLDSQGRIKTVGYGGFNTVKIVDAVQVSTSEVTSAVIDAREYAGLLIIVHNTEDVDVKVKVDISPDQTNWYEYLYTSDNPLVVPSNDYRILEASRSPAPYMRLRLVASGTPTTGSVTVWAILKQ